MVTQVINRRALLAVAVGGVAVGLSGCDRISRLTDTKGRLLSREAGRVEGVESAEIRVKREAEFRPYAIGTISLDAADRAGVLAGYERAMRAVITIIHDNADFNGGSIVVERIEGVGASTPDQSRVRVTLKDLGIRGRRETDFTGKPRRGLIYAASCYDHFGLS